jgi:hypothetical protein
VQAEPCIQTENKTGKEKGYRDSDLGRHRGETWKHVACVIREVSSTPNGAAETVEVLQVAADVKARLAKSSQYNRRETVTSKEKELPPTSACKVSTNSRISFVSWLSLRPYIDGSPRTALDP